MVSRNKPSPSGVLRSISSSKHGIGHKACYDLTEKSSHYMKIKILAVLYKCETWSVKLMEEHRMRMFENWVLIGIYLELRWMK
jgi:hypothetical protein